MDSELLKCSCMIVAVFKKYEKNGVLDKESIDKLMHEQFGPIIANPKHPEEVKKLLAVANSLKEKGADFNAYVDVISLIIKSLYLNKLCEGY
ncbi:repetin-like [Discoglossus pictus]